MVYFFSLIINFVAVFWTLSIPLISPSLYGHQTEFAFNWRLNNNNNNNNTKIYNAHIKYESEARASHQVATRSVLIVYELGYEMRL